MKTLNEAIVERLFAYMREQELTQYRLAQLSGVPFPTIKSIFQKRTKGVTLKTILLVCNGLNVSPSEFLDSELFKVENLNLE